MAAEISQETHEGLMLMIFSVDKIIILEIFSFLEEH